MDENFRDSFHPHILKINNDTHWFLKNKNTNEVVDITRNQFPFNIDYTNSRRVAFLTKSPSKRSQILISRVNESN